jgi:hypothetical protein
MKNKILSLVLASMMALAVASPAYALELDADGNSIEKVEYQEDVTESSSATVDAQVKSTYRVMLPKTVAISSKTKQATYYVKVEGDISDSQAVEINPSATVTLASVSTSATHKPDVTGTITQDKTTWYWDTLETNANGLIDAPKLSAGKWTGKFYFNIELKDI